MPLFHPGDRVDTYERRNGLYLPAFNPFAAVWPTPTHGVWAGDPLWSNPGDGNAVSSWRNTSGGGDPANTGSNRPTYRAVVTAMNYRPAVEFTRSSSQSLMVDISDISQPFKFIVVAKAAAVGGTLMRFMGGGSSAAGQGTGVNGTPNFSNNWGSSVDGGSADTNTHVHRVTVNGASSQYWRDETSAATGNFGASNLTRWAIGSGWDGTTVSNYWDGHIAFVAVYPSATSDASLTELCNALRSHYATA